ncbi:hypothetical protein B0T20DRAFT_347553 [Sordaria brevicollis]|uniref:Uncharacterized protein n=1 Tax=Sordaria brevicollis TaxID=83679 RepID=A0AAE0PJ24_SORBR|nr:hypothetical protein B0T20DRAFT_347553 [Sordaria brevicollis]
MQSQSYVRAPQQGTWKETELERQARRERESWERLSRARAEEGSGTGGIGRQGHKEILINGERYVRQGSREQFSNREVPLPQPPLPVATESTSNAGADQGPIWQRVRELLERTIAMGNTLTASSAKPEGEREKEEERGKMKTEPTSTRWLESLPSLGFGNGSVPPRSAATSSHSHHPPRGSTRRQPSSRNYPTRNTAEAIAEANACPDPFRQASWERRAWENERAPGVEYVKRPVMSSNSRQKASKYHRYPPAPTAVTVPESDVSSHDQPTPEAEDQTHDIYRVPSFRLNSTHNPQPQHHSAVPAANTRRRRRRGYDEELPTVTENSGPSAHGHGRNS